MQICENYISQKEAKRLKAYIEDLDDAWFVSRKEHMPNLNLDGNRSDYDCLFADGMPHMLLNALKKISPPCTSEIIVNRYKKGQSIGKHHDKGINPYMSILHLSSNHECFCLYDSSDTSRIIPDKPGQLITFSCDEAHEVLPVENTRYSIVFLRSAL